MLFNELYFMFKKSHTHSHKIHTWKIHLYGNSNKYKYNYGRKCTQWHHWNNLTSGHWFDQCVAMWRLSYVISTPNSHITSEPRLWIIKVSWGMWQYEAVWVMGLWWRTVYHTHSPTPNMFQVIWWQLCSAVTTLHN